MGGNAGISCGRNKTCPSPSGSKTKLQRAFVAFLKGPDRRSGQQLTSFKVPPQLLGQDAAKAVA